MVNTVSKISGDNGERDVDPADAFHVFPPINGTRKLFGGVCKGVVKVEA